MASAYTAGAFCSEEGFQRFLNSIEARGLMYASNDYSRDKLEDQMIEIAMKEYDRYWKYLPGGYERLDWTLKIQIHPSWKEEYERRRDYMMATAPNFYQPY